MSQLFLVDRLLARCLKNSAGAWAEAAKEIQHLGVGCRSRDCHRHRRAGGVGPSASQS